MHLRLPFGYHARLDPDTLVLERADGSVVARFSVRSFVAEEVGRTAREDHGDAAKGPLTKPCP